MSIVSKIMNSNPRLHSFYERVKVLTLPGFDNVPLYDVVVFFIKEMKRNVISIRAKAIAFTFFLALFPGFIFLFTLIPYIPIANLQENLINFLQEIMPGDSFLLLENTIRGVIQEQRVELLSIGLLLALFVSTNGVMAMMESFDKSYAVFVKRNALVKRWVALKLTIVLFFLLVISIIAIVEGNLLLKLFLKTFNIMTSFNFLLFSTLKWLVILMLFFNSISFIYYYGPAVKKKFRFISAGSTLATLVAVIISIAFSYFVNNFGSYNRFYGSIGTVIALQVYIYLNAFALLLGFELNASIAINKNLRERKIDDEAHEGNIL